MQLSLPTYQTVPNIYPDFPVSLDPGVYIALYGIVAVMLAYGLIINLRLGSIGSQLGALVGQAGVLLRARIEGAKPGELVEVPPGGSMSAFSRLVHAQADRQEMENEAYRDTFLGSNASEAEPSAAAAARPEPVYLVLKGPAIRTETGIKPTPPILVRIEDISAVRPRWCTVAEKQVADIILKSGHEMFSGESPITVFKKLQPNETSE